MSEYEIAMSEKIDSIAAQLQSSLVFLQNIEIWLRMIIVIGGIVISFVVVWFMWKLLVKPVLGGFFKFQI